MKFPLPWQNLLVRGVGSKRRSVIRYCLAVAAVQRRITSLTPGDVLTSSLARLLHASILLNRQRNPSLP